MKSTPEVPTSLRLTLSFPHHMFGRKYNGAMLLWSRLFGPLKEKINTEKARGTKRDNIWPDCL